MVRPRPVIEEDIALANVSLDLIGQARLLYQQAATGTRRRRHRGHAGLFPRRARLPQPHAAGAAAPHALAGYAGAISTTAPPSCATPLQRADGAGKEQLQQSQDEQLAAIAAKSLKEVRYHLRHSRDWLVRLGDGTEESHARVQAALDHLMPHRRNSGPPASWSRPPSPPVSASMSRCSPQWDELVDDALAEATLVRRTSAAT